MRILFIITRSTPIGGAQIHVRDLAQRLQAAGHDVKVLVGSEGKTPNTFTSSLGAAGVPFEQVPNFVQPIKPLADIRAYRALRKLIGSFQPDLISTHSSKAGVLGRLAGKSLKIPTIFTAHGWAFADGVSTTSALVYRTVERAMAPLAAKIITVSEADRDLAIRHKVANPDALVAVHNGMPDISETLLASPQDDPVTLVMIARFQPQKDHPLLFKALAKLRDLDWTLNLIGDGPLRDNYETLIGELGISNRVRFLSERDDIAQQLAEASVFLLISNWEGFPRSILEAMRAGLPVIASNVGGAGESVMDNSTGFLIPRGDEASLTRRLHTLITNPEARSKMGSAGRARYANLFTFDHMLAHTLAVYAEVTK